MANVEDDQYNDAEIRDRMERSLRRAFTTPHKPHGKNPKTQPAPKRPAPKGRAPKARS